MGLIERMDELEIKLDSLIDTVGDKADQSELSCLDSRVDDLETDLRDLDKGVDITDDNVGDLENRILKIEEIDEEEESDEEDEDPLAALRVELNMALSTLALANSRIARLEKIVSMIAPSSLVTEAKDESQSPF